MTSSQLRISFASAALVAGMLLAGGRMPLRGATDQPPGVGPGDKIVLPKPFATPHLRKRPKVIGWPAGRTPSAPAGFRVNSFADGLKSPRSFYVLPNGDVLVAESILPGPNPPVYGRVVLLRDANKDGVAEIVIPLLENVNLPFGMVFIGKRLYIGYNDSVMAYPYEPGQTKIMGAGTKVADVPPGRGHYTRNLIANADKSKIYIAVGSSSDDNQNELADKEPTRAAILEMNPDGSGMRVFASGLRNPVGVDWEPATHTLWTVVNERNEFGDNLVPDYFTSVRDGAYYGWPYSYFGQNVDPTQKTQRPDLVAKAVVPDYAVGAHTAPLGLAFYRGKSFPRQYQGVAFIGQHGSVNRSDFAGFKVISLAFKNGKPSGNLQDFLTGFIANDETAEVYGRPVGIAILPDGSMLVADDEGNKVWRVSYTGGGK